MLCPCCREEMVIVEVDEVELDLCVQGDGMWFDHDELNQLFRKAGAEQGALALEQELSACQREPVRGRRCPRCSGSLHQVSLPHGVAAPVLDACRRGHGWWFDPGELEALATARLGQSDSLQQVQEYLRNFLNPMTDCR